MKYLCLFSKGDCGLYQNVWSVFIVSCVSQLLASKNYYLECTFGVLVSSCIVFFCQCFWLIKSLNLSKSLGLLNTGVWVFGSMLFWCETVCVHTCIYVYVCVYIHRLCLSHLSLWVHVDIARIEGWQTITTPFTLPLLFFSVWNYISHDSAREAESVKNSVNRFIVKNWFTWLCGWQGESEAKWQPKRKDRLRLWAWAKTAINRWSFISQGGRTPAFKTVQGVNWA